MRVLAGDVGGEGGGLGSIIGRNCFQRSRADALRLLDGMMRIYGTA
jgi:class I fructose-bisphosphate aldolase